MAQAAFDAYIKDLPQSNGSEGSFDIRYDHLSFTPIEPITSQRNVFQIMKQRLTDDLYVNWHRFNGTVRNLYSYHHVLSAPRREPILDIAINFLRTYPDLFKLSNTDLSNFSISHEYRMKPSGVSHMTLQQLYQGIEVFQAGLRFNIDRQGQIVSLGGEYYPALFIPTTQPQIGAEEAVE